MRDQAHEAAHWLRQNSSGTLCADSRQVRAGDAFIAWPGAAVDARTFVPAALQAGAQAVLVESRGKEAFALDPQRVAGYPGLKAAAGPIAAEFFDQPSAQLDLLAVTGTNGKTSTAWWLAQALSALPGALARPCGLIGTLGIGCPPPLPQPGAEAGAAPADALGGMVASGLTTPDPVLLQRTLRNFVDTGLRACAIEASSIGLEEQRLAGSCIRLAIFTNFTQDHLDYHGGMQAYWLAKRRLFDWPGLQSAVINIDDQRGHTLAGELDGAPIDLWTVAIEQPARLRATDIGYQPFGMQFAVHEGDAVHTVQVPLMGVYNVSNVLGVLGALRALGVPLADAVAVCNRLQPVPGRMECLGAPDAPLVAVDYAHTPDALDAALKALRPLAQQREGMLWCVFGCGGGRDASKRPLMGRVAASLADQLVLTSDNPRQESPDAIMVQILQGVPAYARVTVEVDRALAIAQTLQRAAPQDVVLLAGKGHELTQEIGSEKRPFSDRVQVERALAWRQLQASVGNRPDAALLLLQQVLPWLQHATLVGDGSVPVLRIHTDTRTVAPGDLFVALRGEKFDANEMLEQARQRGAVAVLCHAGLPPQRYPDGLPRIEVPDTRAALGALALGWRRQFTLPLIAVTGSNGKTTVTQMLASILDAFAPDDAALATRGNLNNDIGVPLTLLRLRAQHRIAVVELGMNHPGEIAALAALARPTVALVNNAQREHLEFMHTVQAVALENGAVISSLADDGEAVFPADDAFTPLWETLAGTRAVGYFGGASPAARQSALVCVASRWADGAWQVHAQGAGVDFHCRLHIAGRHNVRNALAAARCALAAGVPVAAIVQGLEAFRPVHGRSRALALQVAQRACTLVDDTYNANPDSVQAAIEVLRELPGPGLLVLGDMGEVGAEGPQFHAEAGRHAQRAGISALFCLGELTRHSAAAFAGAQHFETIEALNAAVLAALPSYACVLVMGSRFMRMERVVAQLTPFAEAAPAPAPAGTGGQACY